MTRPNRDPWKLTEDDVDYVAEAFASSIDGLAARIGEGRDGRNAYLCKVKGCQRSAEWTASLDFAHPHHGTPETIELELCGGHVEDWRLDYFRNELTFAGYRVSHFSAVAL